MSKMVSREEFQAVIAQMNAEYCEGFRGSPPRTRRAWDVSKATAIYGQSIRMMTRYGAMTMLAFW